MSPHRTPVKGGLKKKEPMDYRYLGSMFRGPLTGVITIIWHWSRFGTAQPFYHVLLERDATPRYCSQENLSLDLDAKPVSNKRCAQVFPDGFDARAAQYVPSPELAARYPDDMRIIDERRQLLGCSGGGGGGGETEAAEQPTARSDQ